MNGAAKPSAAERLRMMEESLISSISGLKQEYTEVSGEVRTEEGDRAEVANSVRILNALIDRDETRLAGVQAALTRISNGHYGICTQCGSMIDPERIDAEPDTALCLGCMENHERHSEEPRHAVHLE